MGLSAYRNVTGPTRIAIRRVIDGSKNALFIHHPRKYGLPLLQQMLPVQAGDPDATAWFGGIKEEDWSSKDLSGRGKGKERGGERQEQDLSGKRKGKGKGRGRG